MSDSFIGTSIPYFIDGKGQVKQFSRYKIGEYELIEKCIDHLPTSFSGYISPEYWF